MEEGVACEFILKSVGQGVNYSEYAGRIYWDPNRTWQLCPNCAEETGIYHMPSYLLKMDRHTLSPILAK
jgi:hypothetical protein